MSLASIVGHERPLAALRRLLSTRRLPPALLFAGPRGVGKKKAALALGRALNCLAPAMDGDSCGECDACVQAAKGLDADVRLIDADYQAALLEEDAAKQRTLHVDTVRAAIADVEMRSLLGRRKTAILDDAHLLVPAAANAMLKALEEPPPGTLWILVTHQSERLLPTIRSRCHLLRFGPLAPADVLRVLRAEGRDDPGAERASEDCEGSVARALSLLDAAAPDPSEWLADPLAPFRLAEGLPRELHLQRALVEEHLARMSRHLLRGPRSAAARSALRELARLRAALASNVDPRLTLELAALRLQALSK
ncbi:MAG: hypothetical protein WC969_10710 [Elusimicrobiota bacterium]|jgi:DNA polymerase III delta' subunit